MKIQRSVFATLLLLAGVSLAACSSQRPVLYPNPHLA